MRSAKRTLDRSTLQQILPICVTVALIGVSYGVTATGEGFALWQLLSLAVLVLGASSELLFVALAAAGTGPLLVATAGLLVNSRNLAYGVAVGPLLRTRTHRLLGAHLVNDETAALAAAQPTAQGRRKAFWSAGAGIALAWPAGALLGAALGQVVPDPRAWGLDAVFPAVLAALALPHLSDRPVLAAALVGSALALVLTPYVPQGLAPVLALAGLVAVPAVRRCRR